jgi:serine/threonine protein kinase
MPEPPQNGPDANVSARNAENAGGGVSLFLRIWAYGGPLQPLSTLGFDREPEIAELVRGIVHNPAAGIPENAPQFFSARFENVLDATSTAKAVQQRFLRYRRRAQPNQVIPTILICRSQDADVSGFKNEAGTATLNDILARENAGQILVSGSLFESIKSSPGLQFNSKPIRDAGPSGAPEALYELLWTDESTYGHLRNAILTRQTVGRYEIQHELGRGAMAAVYKAHDQVIGRTVALKVISLDLNTPDRADILERLKREAQAAGKLDHPNIITIYDVGQDADVVYLSMQFLQGQTLLTYLAHTGVPALSTLISWADQICGAVGFAHSHGVIHRDLKPANLMLTDQGVIKVLDFGIAKIENATLTQTGLVVGTPSYMSPEQVAGKKIDHRTDIFSLGAVFYELVTREKPFRGDVATILYKIVNEDPPAPSIINPALPGGIDAIIRKALAKNPSERFQSCEEMRKAFLEHSAQLSITAPVSLPLSAAAKELEPRSPAANDLLAELLEETAPRQGRRIWPMVAAALALALAASTSWVFYRGPDSSLLPATARKAIASMRGSLAVRFSRVMTDTKSSVMQYPSVDTDDPAQYGSAENRNVAVKNAGSEAPASPDSPAPVQAGPDSAIKSAPPSTQATVSSTNTEEGNDASHASSAVAESATPGAQRTSGSDMAAAPQPSAPSKTPTAPDTNAASTNSRPAKLAVALRSEQPPIVAPVVATKTQKARREAALTIDGFTRHDVPELLREADAAAGRGDYRLAMYSYNLILKLDPGNPTAKAGLRRVQAAQQSQ